MKHLKEASEGRRRLPGQLREVPRSQPVPLLSIQGQRRRPGSQQERQTQCKDVRLREVAVVLEEEEAQLFLLLLLLLLPLLLS